MLIETRCTPSVAPYPLVRRALPGLLLAVASGAMLGGCADARLLKPSSWWPWRAPETVTAGQVHESQIVSATGGTVPQLPLPQFWARNTLQVDLGALGGSGELQLRPRAGAVWPLRLAFSVQPGSFSALEVLGAQRMQFVVPGSGAALIFELSPGVYRPDTESLRLRWR